MIADEVVGSFSIRLGVVFFPAPGDIMPGMPDRPVVALAVALPVVAAAVLAPTGSPDMLRPGLPEPGPLVPPSVAVLPGLTGRVPELVVVLAGEVLVVLPGLVVVSGVRLVLDCCAPVEFESSPAGRSFEREVVQEQSQRR